MGFFAADTGMKHAFIRFVERAINEMLHRELMDNLINSSFERWVQSEVPAIQMAEEVCRHLSLLKQVSNITGTNVVKENVVQNKSTVEPKRPVDFSSKVFEDDFALKHRIRHQLGKTKIQNWTSKCWSRWRTTHVWRPLRSRRPTLSIQVPRLRPLTQMYKNSKTNKARNTVRRKL